VTKVRITNIPAKTKIAIPKIIKNFFLKLPLVAIPLILKRDGCFSFLTGLGLGDLA